MSGQYELKISPEKAKEMPMVDLAFEVLKAANTPFYYRDLMMEIAKIKGLSEEEITKVIAQLYTEINIDGRFACVGENLWGLKRWYPVEKSDDSVSSAMHPRIINDDDDEEEDEELYGEEELYDEDEEYVYDEEDEFVPGDDLFDDDLDPGDDLLGPPDLDAEEGPEDLEDLDLEDELTEEDEEDH